MKHAGSDALDILEPLLARIRGFSPLKEKKRGLFHRNGKSFLHFHDDPAGLFADLFDGPQTWRMRVSDPDEQEALVDKIRQVLAG